MIYWDWRALKHRLAHFFDWYSGHPETFWLGKVLWVGFRCKTCGKLSECIPCTGEARARR